MISSEEAMQKNQEIIKEDMADILIYSQMLCNELGLNVKEIVEEKIKKKKSGDLSGIKVY